MLKQGYSCWQQCCVSNDVGHEVEETTNKTVVWQYPDGFVLCGYQISAVLSSEAFGGDNRNFRESLASHIVLDLTDFPETEKLGYADFSTVCILA